MTYLFETEEHAQLRETVKRFSVKHIAPHAHAWEEAEEFPRELYKQAAGLAAMTKNTATDMCSFVVDQAVQIHGGNGFMREFLVERLYRDARLYPIGGGTREIMNEIISKTEGL